MSIFANFIIGLDVVLLTTGILGLLGWIFSYGLKQGIFTLAGTGLGLFVLWYIGALISGI